MLKEDFIIQSEIRRVLVRSNVDYSRISFGTVKGVVYFRGLFNVSRIYLAGEKGDDGPSKIEEFTIKTLSSFEKKIRSIPGVSDVTFQFVNWKRERGKWVPVFMKEKGEERDEENENPDATRSL